MAAKRPRASRATRRGRQPPYVETGLIEEPADRGWVKNHEVTRWIQRRPVRFEATVAEACAVWGCDDKASVRLQDAAALPQRGKRFVEVLDDVHQANDVGVLIWIALIGELAWAHVEPLRHCHLDCFGIQLHTFYPPSEPAHVGDPFAAPTTDFEQ